MLKALNKIFWRSPIPTHLESRLCINRKTDLFGQNLNLSISLTVNIKECSDPRTVYINVNMLIVTSGEFCILEGGYQRFWVPTIM